MKEITIGILALSLCGCAKQEPVSHTIAENAISATTALEQTLTEECKTPAINTQLTVIKTQIRAVTHACETEKEQIQQEKLKWKIGFFAMITLIALYIAKKVLK